MRRITAISCTLAFVAGATPALAGECTNSNALGTSRTLVIDNKAHLRLGAQQYSETLPLGPKEVVLTFDDGPLAPYTNRILDILAAECVKATYFLVGRMAEHAPELVRRIHREGHTVGTHSLSHPLTFDTMPVAQAEREIDGGIASVSRALGDPSQLAPFFRFPGLARSTAVENYLASRSLVAWSVDLVADDWHRQISSNEVMQRALRRIETRGRGILLLHDIQPATALALPGILQGLKARGFRIVHVVPAGANRPATPAEPQLWASYSGKRGSSRTEQAKINPPRSVPSRESLGVDYAVGPKAIAVLPPPGRQLVVAVAGEDALPASELWPSSISAVTPVNLVELRADLQSIDWPQAVHLADPAETATWPVIRVRHAPAPSPSRKTPARAASAPPSAATCRNFDQVAVGLPPRCKTTGHQLSLQPRSPTG